jgi:integration host factor subunit beta
MLYRGWSKKARLQIRSHSSPEQELAGHSTRNQAQITGNGEGNYFVTNQRVSILSYGRRYPASIIGVAAFCEVAWGEFVWSRHEMTKADLVEEVTQIGDLTRRDGEVVVDTVFDAVIQALQAGDKIEIRGFGSFRIRQRKPRTGRNPKTGDKVEVPAKRVPYFKPSKELRDLVNPKGSAGNA